MAYSYEISEVPWRDQIKEAMKTAGISRAELARRMKTSLGTVNDLLIPSAPRKLTMHRVRLLSLVLPIDGLRLMLDYTEQEYQRLYPFHFLRRTEGVEE